MRRIIFPRIWQNFASYEIRISSRRAAKHHKKGVQYNECCCACEASQRRTNLFNKVLDVYSAFGIVIRMSAKKWKFVSLLEGDKPQEADTFEQAWGFMETWVKAKLEKKNLNVQTLETAIWIETPHGSPMFFETAKEHAHKKGLIKK